MQCNNELCNFETSILSEILGSLKVVWEVGLSQLVHHELCLEHWKLSQ